MISYHAVIAAVCVLVVLCHVSAEKEYDVIVVGAGYAGLAAAKQFHKSHKSFLVLEGKHYLGGRVHNVNWHGLSIPLGAGWIHHPEEEHILVKLARKYKMNVYHDSYAPNNLVFRHGHNGTWISQIKVDRCRRHFLEKFAQMEDLVEERFAQGVCNEPDVMEALKMAGFKPHTSLQKAMEYFMLDFENGVEPEKMAASTYGHTLDGEELIVKDIRGYFYPMVAESRPFLEKIKLGKTVTHIERMYNNNNNNNEHVYRVSCRDGSMFWAKQVLVTVSTGVLQSGNIHFSPPLPQWKTDVLPMFPMAHYCKFFFKFRNTFWDNDRGYLLLATETKGEFVHWQNFNRDNLFPGSHVLQGLLTGDKCKESYKYTDKQIMERAFNVIKKVFSYASRPIGLLRNNFTIDPLFQGSYSYQKPGINKYHYLALQHPIQQSVYFAGEALADDEFGYAHKAYDSGFGTARQMIRCMNNKNSCLSDKPETKPGNHC